MQRCKATKRDGSPCTLQSLRDSDFCWAHDPRNAEKRRSGQSRGGRSKPLSDLASLKQKLIQLGDDVLSGKAKRADAAVAATCYGAATKVIEALVKVREFEEARLAEVQLKVREQEQLLARLEELEELFEQQKGSNRWEA